MNHYIVAGLSLSLALLPGLSAAQQQAAQQQAAQQQVTAQQQTEKSPPVQTEQATLPSAQRATAAVQVDISTTISGNQQQPRTLYILPWQDSIAQIRIPAPGLKVPPPPIQPLDRQQFLRFIEAQSLSQQPASTASTKNN